MQGIVHLIILLHKLEFVELFNWVILGSPERGAGKCVAFDWGVCSFYTLLTEAFFVTPLSLRDISPFRGDKKSDDPDKF